MIERYKFIKTALLSFSFLLIICLIPTGCSRYTKSQKPETEETEVLSEQEAECMIIPKPVEYKAQKGNFTLSEGSSICVNGNNDTQTREIQKIGRYLADKLKPSTGYSIRVVESKTPAKGSIYLTTVDGDSRLGEEGYHLEVTKNKVTLSAYTPEGLFRGIQTIRQLLPAEIEKSSVVTGMDWSMPCSSITDYPTYSWRGMMLDVARHFISVQDVKRTIDLIAQYKMNRFHLHLSDDQGWRIEIKSRPDLTRIGGSTEVGAGKGGYYTQEEYIDIVNYAKERYITVIPEIDMPGHCNAALASYGELNPDGKRKEPYTDINVGFSSLMCRSEVTYSFINDVIGELAAITPGEYLHIGGDEASSTKAEDYDYFIGRVNEIVASYGKKAIGWNPFDTSKGTPSDAILQNWSLDEKAALDKGMKIIMSPPNKVYLDMKYNKNSPIGLNWAGYNPTDDSYEWNPSQKVPKDSVIGIECTLWSETVENIEDIEFLTFPRLLGHAEVGWTPAEARNWEEYKLRLKNQGPRMDFEEINYYKDPVVPW